MKKFIPILLLAGVAFTALSCERDNDVIVDGTDNDTYSQVLETTGTFTYSNGELSFGEDFYTPLYDADQVLVFRLVDDLGVDVWQPIPRTMYLNNGYELDYDYDFSKNDVVFYASGNFDKQNVPNVVKPWITNQTFRVVLLPGYFPNSIKKDEVNIRTMKEKNINPENYDEVIKAFNIDDSKVIKF